MSDEILNSTPKKWDEVAQHSNKALSSLIGLAYELCEIVIQKKVKNKYAAKYATTSIRAIAEATAFYVEGNFERKVVDGVVKSEPAKLEGHTEKPKGEIVIPAELKAPKKDEDRRVGL